MLVEDDEYNYGEAHRWNSTVDCHLKILMLDFTAGQPISLMSERFEQVIQCLECEATHTANFNQSTRPSGINLERGLAFWGMAVLLGRTDLSVRISLLALGEQRDDDYWESEVLNLCFHLMQNGYKNPARELLYNPYYQDLCSVIRIMHQNNDKAKAAQILEHYIKDWYKCRKGDFGYNGHNKMPDYTYYSGYWAFEVAALVYLFDLDDRLLLKSMYYPKDLVEWARTGH
jgi:hypothetical protein